jgi:hypothetical protein
MKEEEWVARLDNELQGSDMLSSRNAFPDGKQGDSFINKAQQRICYMPIYMLIKPPLYSHLNKAGNSSEGKHFI